MVKEDPVVGYIAVAVAVICFGSFAVPAKWASVRAANVHPLVYQTYKTFWCFATSWLALLVPGVQLVFTPFGVLSAVAWVPAGTLAIASIGYAGLGTAQATWSSMIVIISFLWGSVFFQERVDSWPLAASAVAVMCLGIVGMAIFSDPERQRRKARASPTQSPSLLAVADAPLLDVADGGPPLALLPVNDAPATPPPTRRRRAVGIGIALASGTYGGSFAVPLKLAQRAAPDTPAGFEFVVSFGIGAVAVTAVCWALYLAIGVGLLGWRWPSLHLHDGVMIVPGAVAGLAWSAGNMASLLAVTHLGQALGYSACQGSLMVSGLWAILWFREVGGRDAVLWLLAAGLCAGGIVALAWEMRSAS